MRAAFALLLIFAAAQEKRQDDGPVCSWTFDGSLEDPAGSVKDLLAPRGGAARFVDEREVPGTERKAIALGVRPGDAEYLEAPTSTDIRLGPDYTLEAWIHPTKLSAWNRLILNWGKGYAYHLALRNGTVSLHHGQANGNYVSAAGGRVQTGRWQHVVGIARGNGANRLEVYLDGRRVGSSEFDGTIATLPREGLGIGDAAGIPVQPSRFKGYLDEATLWNRALRPDEIRARHARRAPRIAAPEAPRPRPAIPAEVEEIIFAERHPGRDVSRHYYANFGYSCVDPDSWIHGQDGGRLCKLNLRSGKLRVLLDDPKGAVRDPVVSYDARKILFSYRKGGSHHYNLYEINADGTGLRPITRGPWDDVEPAYLPDGGIIFSSSRCKRYILCWLAQAAVLFRCDADGKNLRMLSSSTVTENTPAVLPDGRVLYTRWEYVNRDPVVFHHLWVMNPDGTGQQIYFGNLHPGGVFIDAQPIPGTDKVVFIHSPAHGRNEHEGSLAIVTSAFGPDAKWAMRTLGRRRNLRDPYPLSENAFLVAEGNRILLVDGNGADEVLHDAPIMVHEPKPLVPRPREAVLPPRADASQTSATVILADVMHGRSLEGIEPGRIKSLLVMEDLPKPANYHGGGSQPIGHGVTSTLKRILGTVPVEADGSACFQVPPLRSIYFALLDAEGRSVKQMRSFITLQPGETLTCAGCHEQRTRVPVVRGSSRIQALARPPSPIEPIADVPEIPDYPRDIQPILDRRCVQCHGHDRRDGGVSLVGDRGPVYSHSYYELFLWWQIKDTGGNPGYGSGRQKGNDKPYATYSSASPLMKKIDGSHYETRLTPKEEKTIRLWIDVSAQYAGTTAAIGTGQVGGMWGNNKPVRAMADGWPTTVPAADAVQRRCLPCHGKFLPKHVTDRTKVSYGDMLSWERPLSRTSRHRVFNLSRPEKSLVLMTPLSRTAGGYAEGSAKQRKIAEDRGRPPRPIVHHVVFADRDDPDYLKILAHLRAAKEKLDEIKRFDMPGFKPSPHYVREMKRYGVLPEAFDLAKDPIDAYEVDRRYWSSLWHRPAAVSDR